MALIMYIDYDDNVDSPSFFINDISNSEFYF